MKKIFLLFFSISVLFKVSVAATFTVTNVGTTFSPASITINVGDIINFTLSSAHNVLEVTQDTWNANGTTAKANGFSLPYGGGQHTFDVAGTYYYVCVPHASLGMKGTIIVSTATGIEAVSSSDASVILYPNPASDFIKISYILDSRANVSITMLNNVGSEVAAFVSEFRNSGKQEDTYAIDKFPKGVYVVRIKYGAHEYVKKIVIQSSGK